MTVLVVEPSKLDQRVSAKETEPVFVRFIVQTVEYNFEANVLTVKGIRDPCTIDIYIDEADNYDARAFTKGIVVDITSKYDGKTIKAIEIKSLNAHELEELKLKILESISNVDNTVI